MTFKHNLADIRGNEIAKRIITIALTGRHDIYFLSHAGDARPALTQCILELGCVVSTPERIVHVGVYYHADKRKPLEKGGSEC